ncbi:hypothetical protein SNK03_005443 [Fusarium graminearum]|uniref:Chromosome 2, complete genome n=1 Tax=Gibberella zeae (strain ATCC MYA-4620 / CBS 123657 / FGSC 9075 / NRRL 31084 / PH-1) TaxID=229533 RepID=I1RGM0_GIBZE|nr:hypothetical protein FGSG_02891 [Fusarium graminearum PH-1]ESU10414.1 hypothetical protein FGSG_02891 [Fusarium graminearum PH-1]EYB23567.1 hypothetical protein FG05_02891 [Fusarium graminearum]CAG1992596.1 unnamed protein product [Fusarium graminearum]CEF77579.1 unnamed protein product [Fusarium graminearum]|eukprot:XP_011322913.1 hypothetical protein FGSG_02891 [Fusarium graminearum PH-1]
MGYSEILCRICGVSFNINRYRTDQEPPSAALGEPLFPQHDQCPDKGGCYFVKSSLPPDEQVKYYPDNLQESDLDQDGWNHVAGPDCGHNGAYNGHRISLEAMRGCNTFQCLVYKPEDWTPQTNDEDFESKGKYFLSGLGDDMPSRDMAWPSVFPHRHDVDSPRADECIWNQDEADEYAMPFHPTCLEIYKRVSLKRNGVVDIQGLTLWWRRENTYDDFHHFPRDQDVNDAQEQWWSHDLGNEYLAANPCLIPGFQSLLQSCQNSDTTDFEPAGTTSPTHASTNDPFAKLPPEIQHSILVHLDFKDVANLRLTSRVFLQLPNSVLYELTVRNTPWLYEAWTSRPLSFWATTTQAELEEQWESTCDVLRSANPTMPVHQLSRTETNWLQLQIEISRNWGKLLGLRNRRRIWKDCEEILNRVDRIQAQDKTT